MDRVHRLWEMEGKQLSTRLGNDFIWSEIFFSKLFWRLSGFEELSLDKDFVIYFEIRSRKMSCISRFLIMLLGHGDFSLKNTL